MGPLSGLGEYDAEVGMYVEGPREVDLGRARFLRWLAERGRLEHGVAGRPSGELALAALVRAGQLGGAADGA